jgi:hypothetical protein
MSVIDDWKDIARGDKVMPSEFQRFIAAWELIVLWHRSLRPSQKTDASLKRHLEECLPTLDLSTDPEWLKRVARLKEWAVMKMSGAFDTGERIYVQGPEDWHGIVEALYTVRCNLIKGGKQPSNRNDLALTADAGAVALFLSNRLV